MVVQCHEAPYTTTTTTTTTTTITTTYLYVLEVDVLDLDASYVVVLLRDLDLQGEPRCCPVLPGQNTPARGHPAAYQLLQGETLR